MTEMPKTADPVPPMAAHQPSHVVHGGTMSARRAGLPPRPVGEAVSRGFRMRCPACGQGALFHSYLKINEYCPACGEELWHHRADDAPPYATITVVGHIVVPALLAVEMAWHPPLWLHLIVWLPLTLLLSLVLLQPLKGALIGYQWAVYMHGFDKSSDEYDPVPPSRHLATDAPTA